MLVNKNEDRHKGVRVDLWFTLQEHKAMLDCMTNNHIENKSDFIRSAVKTFINVLNESK